MPELLRTLTRVLHRAVPFDGICLLTIDPATLLPTGEVAENGLPAAARPRLTEIELREPDFNKFTALARARRPAASLSEATASDLDQSLRQRELRRPSGFEDELRAVLAGATGTWGALTLLREAKRPHFTAAEVRFVASLAGPLADGLRRAALFGGPAEAGEDHDDHDGPGLLLLAADNTVEMTNRAADHWLDELTEGARPTAQLPVVVRAVANRARRASTGDSREGRSGPGPRPHRRGAVGGGARFALGDGRGSRVAVLLEAARPPELAPLIADAYGFTERERLVTELVARASRRARSLLGCTCRAYTVQDHLKSIFDKSGTGSRGRSRGSALLRPLRAAADRQSS